MAAQQLRSVDLLRQEALVESTREDRIDAEADAAILRNQLAVLTGQAPGRIARERGPHPRDPARRFRTPASPSSASGDAPTSWPRGTA